jgi:hypothetical protein
MRGRENTPLVGVYVRDLESSVVLPKSLCSTRKSSIGAGSVSFVYVIFWGDYVASIFNVEKKS